MPALVRLLPREHGATAIWFASVLLAFLVLPVAPSILPLMGFLGVAAAALLFVGALTGRSAVLLRMERNPSLLPALSSPLTLIVPIGYVIMAGPPSVRIVSVWLLFLVYTATGIAYTGEAVRAVLKGVAPARGPLVVSATLLVVESALLSAVGWLSAASVAVLAPLFIHRLASRSQPSPVSKSRSIRRLGLAESANLIACAVILAVVSRF